MQSNEPCGIGTVPSAHTVEQTVQRLKALLNARGIKLFAIIGHNAEAEKAGTRMLNTKLLILGNPKSGPPIMLSAPSAALDLPLMILVAEDAAGNTACSSRITVQPTLQSRHGFPTQLEHFIGASHAGKEHRTVLTSSVARTAARL